jgi:hypothetical protein
MERAGRWATGLAAGIWPSRAALSRAAAIDRGYRWRWCEVAFVPVAWIEGAFRGRCVFIVCDPEWLPDS